MATVTMFFLPGTFVSVRLLPNCDAKLNPGLNHIHRHCSAWYSSTARRTRAAANRSSSVDSGGSFLRSPSRSPFWSSLYGLHGSNIAAEWMRRAWVSMTSRKLLGLAQPRRSFPNRPTLTILGISNEVFNRVLLFLYAQVLNLNDVCSVF